MPKKATQTKNTVSPVHVGMRFVIGWIIGLVALAMAFDAASVSFVAAVFTFLAACMAIPTVWSVARKHLGLDFSLPLRIVTFFILMVLAYGFFGAAVQ